MRNLLLRCFKLTVYGCQATLELAALMFKEKLINVHHRCTSLHCLFYYIRNISHIYRERDRERERDRVDRVDRERESRERDRESR